MKIGIIDYDLIIKPGLERLNVEAMKLAGYYEDRECQVDILSPKENIFYYDKIIIFANHVVINYADLKEIKKHPNVEYFGASFNNGDYIPFGIKEIDYGEINNKFYNNFLKYMYEEKKYSLEKIKEIKKKKFIRLYPDEKIININKLLTGEKFYVVDSYIFNKENWRNTAKFLSIFYRNFSFIEEQIINNEKDFDNFLELLNYKFPELKGKIRLSGLDDFNSFLAERGDQVRSLPVHRIKWEIAYDKTNNYTEKFYQEEFYNTLLKVKILNEHKIKTNEFTHNLNTRYEFTKAIFDILAEWGSTNNNTKNSFNEFVFFRIRKKKIRDLYLQFLEKHEEYKPLINIIYQKEENEC